MLLTDVNVLVYAFREDSPNHLEYRQWLEDLVNSEEDFGVSELVLSGFLRVTTHRKIFTPPSPLEEALGFVTALRAQPNCSLISPGPRHWEIFSHLCRHTEATGNLVPDCYLAALAIESGSEWVTTDGHFGRFPGLSWRHPLPALR